MRRYQKTLPALAIIATFVLMGITRTELEMAHGQSEGEMSPYHERKLTLTWGRSPFLLPSGVHLLQKSAKKTASKTETNPSTTSPVSPLEVKAILMSDHIRLATIGRQIVTVGDMIKDQRVVEIKTDRVILGKGNKKRTILLYQSPIDLTVEEKR